MPVSGLVLTLGELDSERDAAVHALRDRPEITLGDAQGRRLPIVVDTHCDDEDKAIWEWLHELRGVLFVDLVSADLSEDPPPTGAPPGGPPAGPPRERSTS